MEYTYELIWLSLWPLTIYLSYKLIQRNVKKFEFEEE